MSQAINQEKMNEDPFRFSSFETLKKTKKTGKYLFLRLQIQQRGL